MGTRCRDIGLVAAAVGLALALGGLVLPGCAPTTDVVATLLPLAGDAAAKDASGTGNSGDAGGGTLGDAGLNCQKCQVLGSNYLFFSSIVQSNCVVPEDKNLQQLLFTFLDNNLGTPSLSGETRMLDLCDASPAAAYPHDYRDAKGHFLCPWYCMGASNWVNSRSSMVTACMPCFTGSVPPRP
jgi:hypothetical protein